MQVETRPHINRYNPYCLIANWREDIYQAEAKLGDYLEQKELGSLLFQRTNRIIDSSLSRVPLTSLKDDEFIRDGYIVMIKSSAVKDVYLAANPTIPDKTDTDPETFKSPCAVTGTYNSDPCRRNTFIIRRVPAVTGFGSKSHTPEPILFGQKITFSNVDSCGGLMLHTDLNDGANFSKKSKHQEVSLHSEPTEKLHWQILPRDPTVRFELEGTPVPANLEVVINHVHTNRHLALEKYRIRTIFGDEFEVSAHRYMDQYQVEEIPNIWKIIAASPVPLCP